MVPSGSAEVSALPSRPNCLSSSSSVFSNVDREPPFSRVRLPFSFLFPPLLRSPLFSLLLFIEGERALRSRWIPSDITWRISIRRINSGFVCGINPTPASTGAIYHPQKFHHVVCLPGKGKKTQRREMKVRDQSHIPRGAVPVFL